MSLRTLNRLDQKTANAVLAAAVLSRATVGRGSDQEARYRREVNDLLGEVRATLKIAAEDQSPEARRRVAQVLYKEVQRALGGDELESVADRLGGRGELPLSSYKVRFTDRVLKDYRENGKYVKRVIASASDFQHVIHDKAPPELMKGMTLIVVPQLVKGEVNHWMLIDAIRLRSELLVSEIFRVFPEVVDLSAVNSPLEMLRAFVNVYGAKFSLESLPPACMYEQLTFPKPEKELRHTMPTGSGAQHVISMTGATTELDPMKVPAGTPLTWSLVIAAYCIDQAHYIRDRVRLSPR